MTPYRNPTTPQERQYNSLLKRQRVCTERCFGHLKQIFSILQYRARLKVENTSKVIMCCIVLHNIAKKLRDTNFPFSQMSQQYSCVDLSKKKCSKGSKQRSICYEAQANGYSYETK
nr:unnamed protein product [Callosobruchus analis]